MFTHTRLLYLLSTPKSPNSSCGSCLTPDVYIMFIQGSSLFLLFLFLRKIFSAYFGYQKGIERGLLSRARTFSVRMEPAMLAVGEGDSYRFLR